MVRAALRGEGLAGGLNRLDAWVLAWGVWLLASVLFHQEPSSQLITRLGNVLDAGGVYVLFRVFVPSRDDVVSMLRFLPFLLAPLAILMLVEKATAHNLFSVFGGVPETPVVRAGKVRAQGPFDVSILAGTIAAGCIPLVIALWRFDRLRMVIGLTAAVAMIYACTSSGPILTAVWAIAALGLWPLRRRLWIMRWGAVAAYLALVVAMKDPPYFLMARIDLTGSSTGWHRAEIIRAAINHFSEWWLTGTDRTVHWMPYGIPWSANHTDITNHYLQMGVLGGLPLMALFIATLVTAFSMVGGALRGSGATAARLRWLVWGLGVSLFSHAVTFFSVAYYDQSMVFLYMNLAMIAVFSRPVRLAKKAVARHVDQEPDPHSRRLQQLEARFN